MKSDIIKRYIECPCVKDRTTGEYIPLWKLDFKEDNYDNSYLLVSSNQCYNESSCVNLYFDLLKKEVIIGTIYTVKEIPKDIKVGDKVVRDSGVRYNHKVLDVIESIYYKDNLYNSYIIENTESELSNFAKEYPSIRNISTNNKLIELRVLKPIFKTKKGYETEFRSLLNTYEE